MPYTVHLLPCTIKPYTFCRTPYTFCRTPYTYCRAPYTSRTPTVLIHAVVPKLLLCRANSADQDHALSPCTMTPSRFSAHQVSHASGKQSIITHHPSPITHHHPSPITHHPALRAASQKAQGLQFSIPGESKDARNIALFFNFAWPIFWTRLFVAFSPLRAGPAQRSENSF